MPVLPTSSVAHSVRVQLVDRPGRQGLFTASSSSSGLHCDDCSGMVLVVVVCDGGGGRLPASLLTCVAVVVVVVNDFTTACVCVWQKRPERRSQPLLPILILPFRPPLLVAVVLANRACLCQCVCVDFSLVQTRFFFIVPLPFPIAVFLKLSIRDNWGAFPPACATSPFSSPHSPTKSGQRSRQRHRRLRLPSRL